MEKQIGLISVSISTLFLFTGCGPKYSEGIVLPKYEKFCIEQKIANKKVCNFISKDKKEALLIRGVSSRSSYLLTSKAINNYMYATLQTAADTTIMKNANYFSILAPSKISNLEGILINTPKEFIEKCEISIKDALIFNINKCGMRKSPRPTSDLVIQLYKSKPHNIITYDAKEVITYLKEKDLYDEETKINKILVLKKKKIP